MGWEAEGCWIRECAGGIDERCHELVDFLLACGDRRLNSELWQSADEATAAAARRFWLANMALLQLIKACANKELTLVILAI